MNQHQSKFGHDVLIFYHNLSVKRLQFILGSLFFLWKLQKKWLGINLGNLRALETTSSQEKRKKKIKWDKKVLQQASDSDSIDIFHTLGLQIDFLPLFFTNKKRVKNFSKLCLNPLGSEPKDLMFNKLRRVSNCIVFFAIHEFLRANIKQSLLL